MLNTLSPSHALPYISWRDNEFQWASSEDKCFWLVNHSETSWSCSGLQQEESKTVYISISVLSTSGGNCTVEIQWSGSGIRAPVRCGGSMKKATCDWFLPVCLFQWSVKLRFWVESKVELMESCKLLCKRNAQSPKVENLGMTCSWHIDVLDGSWQARKSSCGGYWRGTVSLFGHSLFSSCMQLLNFLSVSWVASHQLEES